MGELHSALSVIVLVLGAIITLLTTCCFLAYLFFFRKRIKASRQPIKKRLSIFHIILPKIIVIPIFILISYPMIMRDLVSFSSIIIMELTPFLLILEIFVFSAMHVFYKPSIKLLIIGCGVCFMWVLGITGGVILIS